MLVIFPHTLFFYPSLQTQFNPFCTLILLSPLMAFHSITLLWTPQQPPLAIFFLSFMNTTIEMHVPEDTKPVSTYEREWDICFSGCWLTQDDYFQLLSFTGEFHASSQLNSILLYIWTTLLLLVHLWLTSRLFHFLDYYEQRAIDLAEMVSL